MEKIRLSTPGFLARYFYFFIPRPRHHHQNRPNPQVGAVSWAAIPIMPAWVCYYYRLCLGH